jgi:hypothetical protein
MTSDKMALNQNVRNQLQSVSGPLHFMDVNGNPDTMKITKEVKGLAETMAKEFFVKGSASDFLKKLITDASLGNHKVVNPQTKQEEIPYKDIVEALKVVHKMTNIKDYPDELVSSVINDIMMGVAPSVSGLVLGEIRPAYLIYTDKSCRESLVKFGHFLDQAVKNATSVLADPHSASSKQIIDDINYWANNFLVVFNHRFQAKEDRGGGNSLMQGHKEHQTVSAAQVTDRLDKVASQLQGLNLTKLAEQIDMVSNTLETLK